MHFACITETWLGRSRDTRDKLSDFEGSTGIRFIHRSREKFKGGSVALAFNMGTCNFKQQTLKHINADQEVVCAVGKIGKIDRKVVVFVVYVPPSLRAAVCEALSDAIDIEIAAAKVAYKDPILIVGGNFNRLDFGTVLKEADWITHIITGTTRGDHTLDLLYSNITENVVERFTLPPLQAACGAMSDHRCVFAAAKFEMRRNYHWEVKFVRKRTKEAEEVFCAI